jgi:hypothetical protein
MDDETRELLAAYAHDAWSGWMQYLFQHGTQHADGSFTITADQVARWRRQMDTPYAALTTVEQASDRTEADAILRIVQRGS